MDADVSLLIAGDGHDDFISFLEVAQIAQKMIVRLGSWRKDNYNPVPLVQHRRLFQRVSVNPRKPMAGAQLTWTTVAQVAQPVDRCEAIAMQWRNAVETFTNLFPIFDDAMMVENNMAETIRF